MLIPVAILAAAAASQSAAPQASSPPTIDARRPAPGTAELAELLRRVGDYVAEYERSFSDLVAEETYAQSVASYFNAQGVRNCTVCKRTTRADLVFVRLTGEIPWASYRDVFEVDGRQLREHEQRLVRLLSNPGADAQEQARKLLEATRHTTSAR
jgi:hypothetical protein